MTTPSKIARAKLYKLDRADFVPPIRICNSASREVYTVPAWPVRVGGNDHLNIKSKGF